MSYLKSVLAPFHIITSEEHWRHMFDVDLTPFWKAVTCPVLLLRGERSDILPRAVAQAMCDRPQPVKLVEIMDTGHAPALLQESQIRIVADWALQRACPVP